MKIRTGNGGYATLRPSCIFGHFILGEIPTFCHELTRIISILKTIS